MNRLSKLNKSVIIKVTPTLTWQDWELYDRAESAEAAEKLNNCLTGLVGICSREAVETTMRHVMREYSHCGALDTEPKYVLAAILDEIYGDGT